MKIIMFHRLAFAIAYSMNGYEIDVTEPEVVDIMLNVADSSISEEQLINWLRKHVKPVSK
ncbi:MAG: hypothetical protein Q7J85_14190 [Bacillota bacterium]|nr:hypothetical protein [Bacillota bacterium]